MSPRAETGENPILVEAIYSGSELVVNALGDSSQLLQPVVEPAAHTSMPEPDWDVSTRPGPGSGTEHWVIRSRYGQTVETVCQSI